jgi:hypothetical protein
MVGSPFTYSEPKSSNDGRAPASRAKHMAARIFANLDVLCIRTVAHSGHPSG